MNYTSIQGLEADQVEWLDTDASEDEDYLPQFPHQQQQSFPTKASIKNYFLQQTNYISGSSMSSSDSSLVEEEMRSEDEQEKRINSVGWDINRNYRKLSSDTPFDKVHRAIDKTIDDGIERVDISNIGLTEIPDEIQELQYVTILHNDIVKAASLQLYIYNNELTYINPILFRLKNLTVLSLRNNRLTEIPADIALLENLVELSLGNNQLKIIPAELLRLKKLTILSLFPNPYLPLPQDQTHHQRIQTSNITSLTEIATRSILATSIPMDTQVIPMDILNRFQTISHVHYCEHCKILFHTPNVQELVWKSVLGNHHIPVLYRFCSIRCCDNYLTTTG